MESKLTEIIYDIELQAGEALGLPREASEIVGPGRWQVSIRPVDPASGGDAIRNHAAFLNSYAPEDEGLYDDYSAG